MNLTDDDVISAVVVDFEQQIYLNVNGLNPRTVIGILCALAVYFTIVLLFHVIALLYATYLFSGNNKKLCKLGTSSIATGDSDGNNNIIRHDGASSVSSSSDIGFPFVTILKPLRGVDENLEENLRTFFELNYPNYEIFFCIQDPDDPSIEVCKKLLSEYKTTKQKLTNASRLFIDQANCGINPKINNMLSAWRNATTRTNRSELVWICDAGIYVQPNTLVDMVSRVMDSPRTAVCHGMPFAKPREDRTFGELVEKTYFGTQHARHYLVWNLLRQNCMNGQSTLIKTSCFENALGDLSSLASYVAEDFFMGKALDEAGYRMVLSNYPILQNSRYPEVNHLRKFTDRMVRWTRLRMTMIPFVSLLEPFTECMVSGIILTSVYTVTMYAHELQSLVIGLYLYCGYCATWFAFDCFLQLAIDSHLFKHTNFFKIIFAWVTREWTTLYIIVRSVINLSNITWSGSAFTVNVGGQAGNARSESEEILENDEAIDSPQDERLLQPGLIDRRS